MAKAVGKIEGVFHKTFRKALTLTTALAFPLLFSFVSKSAADTIYHKFHDLKLRVPNAIYGKMQKPSTKLEVKVDCDKIAEREYEVKLSFFAQDWNSKEKSIANYVFIDNTSSKFYLAYPKDTVMLGEPKERAYQLSRESPYDKEITGKWQELSSLADSPAVRKKISILKGVSELAPFIFGGGKAIYVLRKASLVMQKEGGVSKDCTISEIPFYPSFKEISARTFSIPIALREKAEKQEFELELLLDLVLERGYDKGKEYGRLENLLIKIPFGAGADYTGSQTAQSKTAQKKLGDNIRDQYDMVISDRNGGGTSNLRESFRTFKYKYNEIWQRKSINVKKGGGNLNIPFSKIESIEFLGKNQVNEEYKTKISFWNGECIEFVYLPGWDEGWQGKTIYGPFDISLKEIKKITFLREDQKEGKKEDKK